MPELPAPRAGAGVVSVGGRVYVCGGSNGSQATATVWSIDPSEPGGTWREEPSMQRPRCALSGACTAVRTAAGEALIVVCGGRSDAGLLSPEAAHVLQSVAVFSLATGTWREDRPLRSARYKVFFIHQALYCQFDRLSCGTNTRLLYSKYTRALTCDVAGGVPRAAALRCTKFSKVLSV